MKTYEQREKKSLEEISEYSHTSINLAIERLEKLKTTLSETGVSIGVLSGGNPVHQEIKYLLLQIEERLTKLKSVLDLHKDLDLPYHLLDSLEIGEHLLIQILIKEYRYDKDRISEAIKAKPEDRYSELVKMLNSNTSSLDRIVKKKTEEREKEEMLNQRHKWANPF